MQSSEVKAASSAVGGSSRVSRGRRLPAQQSPQAAAALSIITIIIIFASIIIIIIIISSAIPSAAVASSWLLLLFSICSWIRRRGGHCSISYPLFGKGHLSLKQSTSRDLNPHHLQQHHPPLHSCRLTPSEPISVAAPGGSCPGRAFLILQLLSRHHHQHLLIIILHSLVYNCGHWSLSLCYCHHHIISGGSSVLRELSL